MAWTFRTMIVADAVVNTCRSLAMLLAGEGQKLWTTPLSQTGTEPATHWISSGLIEQQFALLMPLTTWAQDEQGTWFLESYYEGQPALLAQLSTDAGFPMTGVEVTAIFNECDVTLQDPQTSYGRLGLQMIQPEEPVDG